MAKKKTTPASELVVDATATVTKAARAITPAVPDTSKESALVVTQANNFAAQALVLKVTDKASEQQATNLLLQLRSIKKEGKEKLDFLVKPLKDHVKRIEAEFKPGFEKLDVAEKELGQKVIGWRQMEMRFAEEERVKQARLADEAAAKGNQKKAMEHAVAAVSVETPSRVTHASAEVSASVTNIARAQVSSQKRWTFEVETMGKVPREYLELDTAKVNQAIRSGLRTIPGLKIFQKENLTIGGM